MMKRTGIICIFLAFSVELNTSLQALTKELTCVADYWITINCSLKLPDTSTRNISYWLELRWNLDFEDPDHPDGPYRCPLQRAREDHTCSFTVNKANNAMTSVDVYAVTLHYLENGNKNSSLLDDDFRPAKNIKPKPPFNLMLQFANGTYCFFWKNGYEDHFYTNSLPIVYTFLYFKDGDHDSEVRVKSDDENIQIDEMKLDPGTVYTAMVMTGIHEDVNYSGTWSDWSSAVKWKTAYRALTKELTCVADYWITINCSLKLPDTSTRNISYWLELRWNLDFEDPDHPDGPYRCPLQRAREDHTCSFTVNKANNAMTSVDVYAVTLHYLENGNKNSSLLDDDFRPAKNIKPKPPFNLMLQFANGTYCFFWKNGYEDHFYTNSLPIVYTFLYFKDGDHDSEVRVKSDDENIQIDEMKLDPGTVYTAMVMTGIHEDVNYSGTWSDWSSAVKWKTAYRDEPNQVGKIVIGVIVMLGLFILLISVPAARFKMKEIAWVPTPATYFQPLYQNYQGNFQYWVLSKSPLQDIHVMEDFSTIDKISEVITTLQDQVEKTGMYPKAQCHQPYVGPTAEVWAPRQMPDTCSETSIPCEEFSLFCGELPDKVDSLMQSLSVACLSGDVLSLKDSALSLESLEDCEASEAPVIINPTPMCLKQDYCTLTDTPAGPVPTITRDIELDENNSSAPDI